jgi:hypothetical protein
MHLRSVLCSACLGMWLVWLGASQVAHADGKLAQARREATEADDSDGSSDSTADTRTTTTSARAASWRR